MARKKATAREKKQKLIEIKRKVGERPDGSAIRKSFYGHTKREAEQAYETYKLDLANDMPVVDTTTTVTEWAPLWLKTYILGTVKDNTYANNYEIPIRRHILPYFKDKPMSSIKSVDIQAFLDHALKKVEPGYVGKMRSLLDGMFETAVENRICLQNPVTRSVKVKKKVSCKKDGPAFYTAEQIDLIIDYAKTHKNGLCILILLVCGVSRSELLGLKWTDITSDRVMHIRRGVVDQKNALTGKWEVYVGNDELKNEFRSRDYPLPDWLYKMILQKPKTIYLGGSVRNKTPLKAVNTEFIFHSAKGGVQSPHNWTYYVYQPFMREMIKYYANKKVDMPLLSAHKLRHSAASYWANAGMSLFAISKLGGWSDLKMLSKVYGHGDIDMLRAELNRVQKADGQS
ncbi:site-specific integrase [Neobittarella massiliensis]|uniref:Site-specific integrase n=1 Tax=Neobittarella massiliensis (ex Bilen et al. 2018) TaxID=2041842 RepID=A0A8J6LWJ7_9FIRM|nr:site-specific integrase [Neobittarella massiliensis]MBC3517185.1 site-specific integrase [Neobittarella massiliensis]